MPGPSQSAYRRTKFPFRFRLSRSHTVGPGDVQLRPKWTTSHRAAGSETGRSRNPMHLLIVEDSAPTRDLLTRALGESGTTLVTAARLSTGIRQALSETFDVIV